MDPTLAHDSVPQLASHRLPHRRSDVLLRVLGAGVTTFGLAFWSLAILYAGPDPRQFSFLLAVSYVVGVLWLVPFDPSPGRRQLWTALALLAPLIWWEGLAASNERDWPAETSRLPFAELDGSTLRIRDVRDFSYRSQSDFDARWEHRSYDLDQLRGLDVILSYWGSPAIAHMILSWDFAGAEPLAISIETRRERDEEYSTLAGFFKQYELIYLAADERDLIYLRTHHRGESVYLYRTDVPLERARALLLDYVASMNALHVRPRFYNALSQNCTTTIVTHTRHVQAGLVRLDWRMILNGYSDALMYDRGLVDTRLPFPLLRERSQINAHADRAFASPDFSAAIRQGLPDPRANRG